METQVTQRVESAIRGVNGVDEINSTVSEGNSSTFVTVPARHADRPRGQRRPQRDLADPRQPSRRNPRAAGHPRRRRRRADHGDVGAQTTDMTLEQLSWYIDNTIAKRLLGVEGIAAVSRGGGVDRTIRVILDPAALAGAGHHRRAGQPAAPAKQHERRRRPRRNRRFRTVGSRARQCPGRLPACRRRRSRFPAAASSSWPTSARSRTAYVRAAHAREDERPPGRHLLRPARQGLVRSHRLRRGHGRS